MIYIFGMYAFLAITFLATKGLLGSIDPMGMIAIRMGLSGIIFGVYALSKRSFVWLDSNYLAMVAILGFFNVYVANLTQVFGLVYIDPVSASLWYNSTPFIIALCDFLVYRTKISRMKLASLCLGWAGFLPLVLQAYQGDSFSYLYGASFFIISACAMAISGLIIEKNKTLFLYDMSLTNCLSMIFGALCAYLHYVFFNQSTVSFSFSLSLSICGLWVMVVASTVICAGLYAYLVRRYNALLVTFAGFSLPIFSLLLELITGNNVVITWHTILSSAMITGALYLFTRA